MVSICTYAKPCIQQSLNILLSPPPPPPLKENDRIPVQISFNYAPRSPIDNKPALVQVMARRQTITWTNDDPVQWRIYAAIGEDELTWYKLKGAMKQKVP